MTAVLVALVAAAISSGEAARLAAAARVVHDIRTEIPADYWSRARCAIVIPEVKKAAFIIGGEYGKGMMSCRSGDAWSALVFMQLAKGSWGFQAGAEQVDVVLLVMNEQGAQKLLQHKVSLGADASVAAGPLGRAGGVGTDAALTAEILSYSRAKGLFAGIDLSGGMLRPDEDANRRVYGQSASPRTILAGSGLSAPPQAAPLLQALAAAAPETSRPTDRPATPAAAPRTTTMPVGDDDLCARAVDIQQTIDRLLADTTPGPVGTSGSTTADESKRASVTIERERLLQLRQQMDALIAALNRR